MITVLRRLTWKDYAVLTLAALALVLLEPRNATIAQYGGRGVVETHETLRLGPLQREAFDQDFSEGRYFGAFAIGPKDRYGWTYSHSSVAAARANALAYCEQRGAQCRVVADLVPYAYQPSAKTTLRFRDQNTYQSLTNKSGPRAYAMAENGTSGYSWNAPTIWHARYRAWRNCQARVRQAQPDFLPRWRCKVIYSAW